MNLIIDVGNSYVKLAVFDQSKLIEKKRIKNKSLVVCAQRLKIKYSHLDNAIVSSVGRLNPEQLAFLKPSFKLLILSSKTKVPFKNLYGTPKTLGVDRIALVSASIKSFSNQNVLIIDAGTCVTFDFINAKNQYLGGAISPGIRLRYQALHNLTANLPLLETQQPDDIIGDSTESSIHSGVVNGLVHEIDGVVKEYLIKYPNLTVILTGGDANFLSKRLKSSIFANSNFLLEGLNYILQYNSN